ncbi:serine threonine protein kinase : Putative serine/threonine protein kinase (Fragment) OS=Gemmata sp. Wa1-1 PE=3 SV=1: Pkinase [Gemmataceae bacterium]
MVTTGHTLDLPGLVEASRLLPAGTLEPYRALDAERAAAALVRDGLLTPFQARVLLKGRVQNFFLTSKFKILDHLGTGGMGRVYLCEHLILRRLVAVKVLTVAANDAGTTTPARGAVERFLREARAVAALDHKNIIRVFDVERSRGAPFMVMEYVDGIDLGKYVAAHGPLEPNRAADYVLQAAEGLDHAHGAGLVHRDVKPTNLLLDRTGTVRLLDLGLARFQADAHQNQGVTEQYDANLILGTADFMAPEQAVNSSQVDTRADVYGLGCSLHYLLTGKVVFEADSLAKKLVAHQMKPPAPIRARRPDVPEGLDAVFAKMVAKRPEDRYQTPAEVAAALRPFAVPPPGLPDTARMPKVSARTFKLGLCPGPGDAAFGSGSVAAVPATAPEELSVEPDGGPGGGATERTTGAARPRGTGLNLAWVALGCGAVVAAALAAVFWPGGGAAGPAEPGGDPKAEAKGPGRKPADPKRPPADAALTPAAAAGKIGERVTVQFPVESVGGKTYVYLNSRRDFTARDNFTVALPPRVQTGRWARSADDVVGKTVRATGVVKLFKDAPQLEIADAKDLVVLD